MIPSNEQRALAILLRAQRRPDKAPDALRRDIVARIKQLALLRDPPYELPGEQHLEQAALDIVMLILK